MKGFNAEEKRSAWEYAFGLQKIDNYEPTEEYMELVEREINGEITTNQMKKILIEKYKKESN